MYPKTEPKANFPELERDLLRVWRELGIFKKSLDQTKNGAPFSFYDGPPFGNGLPHWGHLGVSAVKDMVCRYQTMRGRLVRRELGWDCHGLPAENSVEKKQGKPAKDIVADSGLDEFCQMCRADVQTYTNEWKVFIERMGRWVDSDDNAGYRTMDMNYMESVIWTIKTLHDRGLLYKDYRVNPYDWKLGTVLSNSEASMDYRDVVDDAITVWFKLADGRRVLAWTTTPWTLPANQALAINPKVRYAEFTGDDGAVYIARANYDNAALTKVRDINAADLLGQNYAPLFDYYDCDRKIISADFVSDTDGTGIVHIAPAFGEDDFWAVKSIDPKFPIIVNVDDYGNFAGTDWDGENIFDASPKIIARLKADGRLFARESYKHSYPYGDRSKEKLIYRATDSWYIDVSKIQDKLLANNDKVWWTSAGGRFRSWIENARPWAISRNRFWGTPLPIWERDGEYKIFGSIAEIEEFFGAKLNDLHRPSLDALTRDGWKRIPDVLDCWVESGSMPWASLHYPFQNADRFAAQFPADYIIEGQDQTRGWFYSLMVLAVALFDKPAFKTVSANGMVVDENKKKFSKSLKNYTNPDEQIEQFGADAVRLFILGSGFMKSEAVPVDKAGKVFNEPLKSILSPLWSAYYFFTLYANAGKIQCSESGVQGSSNVLDKYILLELNSLRAVVGDALDNYQPDAAVREFAKFLDILNNWYIRLCRARFWDEDQSAFDAMHFVLTEFCKLLAPFAPFVSDHIFRGLTGRESVHLEQFSEPMVHDSDNILESMRRVQQIVSVGKQLREKYKLRNRLPLRSLTLAQSAEFGAQGSEFNDIIKEELNIREIKYIDATESVADSFVYLLTPKIGARLGSALREIIPAVKNSQFTIRDSRFIVGDYELNSDEFEMRLTVRPGITGAALPDNTAVVVLDTNLTPELIATGLANDARHFIQEARKTAGLDVSDRIKLSVSGDAELIDAIRNEEPRIKNDVLAVEISYCDSPLEYATTIEGLAFSAKIEKCN
ncbi:MAG: isoleucine--tRNA ligase [Rickettsiales bacterium]|nr:isoleucine--tRNA ligase [Rickettsiales bacterium]